MRKVTEHDFVTVIYEGLLSNGEVFESSADAGPLSFQLGTGSVLAAFEQALLGMTVQERKTVRIPPEAGYGARRPELVHTVPGSTFGGKEITPGMVLGFTVEKDGQQHQVPGLVTAIDGDTATVDFNHPLAGQELTYEITLQSIDQGPLPDQDDRGCQSSCSTGCAAATGCGGKP